MTGLIVALLVLQVILSWFNLPGISGYLLIALWGGILIFLLFFNYVRASRTRAIL